MNIIERSKAVPVWANPPECPKCGKLLKQHPELGEEWRCLNPEHNGEKSVWLDYELTMILQARLTSMQARLSSLPKIVDENMKPKAPRAAYPEGYENEVPLDFSSLRGPHREDLADVLGKKWITPGTTLIGREGNSPGEKGWWNELKVTLISVVTYTGLPSVAVWRAERRYYDGKTGGSVTDWTADRSLMHNLCLGARAWYRARPTMVKQVGIGELPTSPTPAAPAKSYMVVRTTTLPYLEEKVSYWIDNGWVACGGLQCVCGDYLQSLRRDQSYHELNHKVGS